MGCSMGGGVNRGRRLPGRPILVPALVCTLACALAAGVGALPEAVEQALPEPREVFRVGIVELSGANTSPEARVAAVTFPRLLYELLAGIDERDLSEDELRAYAAVRLRSAVLSEAATLRSAVAARDRLLFEQPPTTPAARITAEQRRASAERSVRDARARLDLLSATDPAQVPAPRRRPLVFWAGHATGRLLEAADHDRARQLATTNDLDMLLWGTVDEIGGYLAVDLYAYHRFMDRSVPAGSTIARPEELGLDAEVVAGETALVVLGRAYATLEVATGDPAAAVTVNGVLRGFGRIEAPFLRPGFQEVRVQVDGRAATRTIELAAGERRIEEIEPPPLAARTIRLRSSPAGADAYADSVWIGRTPLDHEFPVTPTIVRLRHDGYHESRFVVDGSSPHVVSRAMLPAAIDWSVELRDRRDGFYQALTWFVLSVPATVLLRGGYQSVRGVWEQDLDPTDRLRLGRRGNILYWSSIGSGLVNVGLFVNLLISIFDYIEVGEGPHNQ